MRQTIEHIRQNLRSECVILRRREFRRMVDDPVWLRTASTMAGQASERATASCPPTVSRCRMVSR